MARLGKEASWALDIAARKSSDPYSRRSALEIAYLISKNKLPSALAAFIAKSDSDTIMYILERIEKERPDDVHRWLIENRETITAPPKET